MNRPSKAEIKAALDKLKNTNVDPSLPEHLTPKVEGKKQNKNRIRKQGV